MSGNAEATQRLEHLRRHVDMLAERIGERNTAHPEALDLARDYIAGALTQMGYAPHEDRFAIRAREAVNYEVRLAGTQPQRSTLVIGAHYDSAPGTPGADDNASAVAILLEVLRALAGRRGRHTVRAVFYDTEENPHFAGGEMGSQRHAWQCRQRREKLMGMLALESLGYFGRTPEPQESAPRWMKQAARLTGGRHAVLVANPRSTGLLLRTWPRLLSRQGVPILPIVAPRRLRAIERSDHRGYWDLGYSALMLTDTAFLRNPHYHQATDRLATLNLPAMARLTGQLTRAVASLATIRLGRS